MVEVTTSDKAWALLTTLADGKYLISIGVFLILSGVAAQMRKVGARVDTRIGRLGLVVHWASILVAAAIAALGGVIAAQSQPSGNGLGLAFACWGVALLVWLTGKAVRFVLTGTTAPQDSPADPERRSGPVSFARPHSGQPNNQQARRAPPA